MHWEAASTLEMGFIMTGAASMNMWAYLREQKLLFRDKWVLRLLPLRKDMGYREGRFLFGLQGEVLALRPF